MSNCHSSRVVISNSTLADKQKKKNKIKKIAICNLGQGLKTNKKASNVAVESVQPL